MQLRLRCCGQWNASSYLKFEDKYPPSCFVPKSNKFLLDGKPIEEFLIAWEFSGNTKVTTCANKASPKDFLPESIDGNTTCKWVILQEEPLR